MERLTFKTDGLNGFSDRDLAVYGGIQSDGSEIYIGSVADKLAKYEDLEEQGKMLILPCAVGDTVYRVKCRDIHNRKEYFVDEKVVQSVEQIVNTMQAGNFGKTVFLTREETEVALERREANETD